jgi:hypothetical protein
MQEAWRWSSVACSRCLPGRGRVGVGGFVSFELRTRGPDSTCTNPISSARSFTWLRGGPAHWPLRRPGGGTAWQNPAAGRREVERRVTVALFEAGWVGEVDIGRAAVGAP